MNQDAIGLDAELLNDELLKAAGVSVGDTVSVTVEPAFDLDQ